MLLLVEQPAKLWLRKRTIRRQTLARAWARAHFSTIVWTIEFETSWFFFGRFSSSFCFLVCFVGFQIPKANINCMIASGVVVVVISFFFLSLSVVVKKINSFSMLLFNVSVYRIRICLRVFFLVYFNCIDQRTKNTVTLATKESPNAVNLDQFTSIISWMECILTAPKEEIKWILICLTHWNDNRIVENRKVVHYLCYLNDDNNQPERGKKQRKGKITLENETHNCDEF